MDIDFFNILNQYFDKVIVLTIERNKQRLSLINQNLQGLAYEVFIGVDGKNLNLDELQKSNQVSKDIEKIYELTNWDYLNMASPPIHINQVACALSHVAIYKYLQKNSWNKVLILEDDVIPVEKNLRHLAATLKNAPKDWEVLYLGYMINDDFTALGNLKYSVLVNLLLKLGISSKTLLRKDKTFPKPYSKFFRKNGAHTGTHAYAVTKTAAEKLINMQQPLQQVAADLLLMDAIVKNIVTAYTSRYLFFDQNNFLQSSIWADGNINKSLQSLPSQH